MVVTMMGVPWIGAYYCLMCVYARLGLTVTPYLIKYDNVALIL